MVKKPKTAKEQWNFLLDPNRPKILTDEEAAEMKEHIKKLRAEKWFMV